MISKQCILTSFFVCIISTSSWAKGVIQNETKTKTKTYTIDWKIPSYGKNSFPKKQKYESDCKPITIETPKWASIRSNFIIISKKFTKNKTNPYISTSNFNFSCKTKNIQMSDSSAIYNSQTQQWDLSLDDKKELIYVIGQYKF